jgi:hemolysin D
VSTRFPDSGAWELLERYRRSFAFHWGRRGQWSGMRLTWDEAEFSPPTLALEQRPISPTLRLTACTLVLLVLVLIVWATLGHVDIVAKASGKVIPGGRTKTIASVDTASVRAIHVLEGQTVRAGDVLIELDATPLEADRDKATGDERAALLTIARSRAMLTAVDDLRAPRLAPVAGISTPDVSQAQSQLAGQYADFSAKLAQANQEIQHYADALPPAQEREKIYASLLAERDVSRDAWLEKEQARLDIQGHLAEAQSARASLIAQTKHDALDALADASKAAANSREDAIHADSHARWLTLRSPEDGTVQELSVHTLGGVVEAAQPLMLIVPASKRVEVEASVADKDIGFVQVGQSASVKVAAFEYTKFGVLPGVVSSISHDAVENKQDHALTYSIRVLLDRSTIDIDGHPADLSPGMSVDVDIKTGRRRIVDYLLSPLLRHRHESLHER